MKTKVRLSKNKQRVLIGLSGGVDSSVSAALLKERGYEVIGAFIKVWTPPWLPCPWREDRRDAMRVAALLGIPFITVNLEKEYKKEIIDYMIREYKAGRTPNPDIMCNKSVKFGAFLKKTEKLKTDFVATGHYARIAKDKVGKYKLLKGVDAKKDQSYFLAMLNQKQLSKIVFPVGGYLKSEVRKLALRYGLPTAGKKDSQGLCFLGEVDMKDFLKKFIRQKPGKVLDENGKVIGRHDGVWFLTIGQRHGFEIIDKNAERKPHYVVKKDVKKNTAIVSDKPLESGFAGGEVALKDTTWCSGDNPQAGAKNRYSCVVRYHGKPLECFIKQADKIKKTATVILREREYAIPQGQFMAIYKGEECLGGGVVSEIKL